MGATIQDQERNRAYFEEAYEIIMKCWTEESFSHHGEFFTIPPTLHPLEPPADDRLLQRARATGATSRTSSPSAGPTCTRRAARSWRRPPSCKELQVYPQPVQKPYPQMWQPLTSPRSIEFAAQHGINGYFIVEPNHAAQAEHRHLLRRRREGRLARPPRPRRVQVRLGRVQPPRHHHRPLHPHRRQGHRRPRPRRPGAGGAVGLLRPVRLRRRARRSGRDRRHGPQGDGRGAARAQGSPSTARSTS